MIFVLTLNMPSAKGNLVHQVYIEHSSEDVSEFAGYLNSCQANGDFITFDELYKDNRDRRTTINTSLSEEDFYKIGETVINLTHIGKVRKLNTSLANNFNE